MRSLSPEALEKQRAANREWAKAHYAERRAKHKQRMLDDPEYAERQKALGRAANNRRRSKLKELGLKQYESPEAAEKRKQRERERKAKKYKEWRLANPIVAKPKEPPPPPKPKVTTDYKRKPGRLVALMGWRGY